MLTGVEINTSFYRNHKAHCYRKWANEVPDDFRFSVKLSKELTHVEKLEKCGWQLEQVIPPILELGEKLGCLLVQLPPKLEFSSKIVEIFLKDLRSLYSGPVVIEPRHATWKKSLKLLGKFDCVLVRPDPNPTVNLEESVFGNNEIYYCRLHGSPQMYRTLYTIQTLERFLTLLEQSPARNKWCVFDNTMFGHGTINALEFLELLRDRGVKFPRVTGHESAKNAQFESII